MGPVQWTYWQSRTSCRKFWWLGYNRSQSSQWRFWISKQSSKGNRGAGLGHSMDTVLSVQNENFSGDGRETCNSFSSCQKSRQSFTLTTPWSLAEPVKTYHGTIELQHLIDPRRMVLLKQWYAEEKKERLLYWCHHAWLKNDWLILWNADAIFEMSKTSWQMGKLLVKGYFGEPFKGPVILSGAMVEYYPISAREASTIAIIVVDLGKYSGCRNWGVGKDGRIGNLSSKNQRKRSNDATKGRWFHIPKLQIWHSKIVRKRPWIPRTHSKAGTTRMEWRSQRRTSRRTGFRRIQQNLQDKACVFRGSSWIHDEAFRTHFSKRSWRSHCGERIQFDKSLQLGAHIYSAAPSDENGGCDGRRGQGMEEARKVASVERVKSNKEVILEVQREEKSPLCHIDGHLSSQKCGARTKIPEV